MSAEAKSYSNNYKRETEVTENDKEKRVKLSESDGSGCEKENLDPKKLQTAAVSVKFGLTGLF